MTQPASLLHHSSILQGTKEKQQLHSNSTTGSSTPLHPQGMKSVKISFEDIVDEVRYWESAVVCYIIGANPPLHVIDGYVKRILKDLVVEKVGMVRKGVFIVKLVDKPARDKACEMSGILFDTKPFIIKPWKVKMSLEKETYLPSQYGFICLLFRWNIRVRNA